ncbi:MAG: AAA family ATPase [Muribaculaceae bacterium]|nr:AAA family ATPase [Muribaculaceae bacterium]
MFTLAKKQQIDNYTITFPVKEGDYAETYRVKDSAGKNRFLKLINCAKLHRTQFDSEGNVLEVEIAKQLDHPNIVKYRDSGETIINSRKYAYIVFDYISGETTSQFLAREGDCSVYNAKIIVIGILNGLKFLHSLHNPIIHNEITLQNVMVDVYSGATIPKIIDFGYARYLSQGSSAFNKNGLSPFYLAPEALNGVFSVKSDIFSAGAILFNLVFGMPPYFVELADCSGDVNLQREKIDAQRELPLYFPKIEKFELDDDLMNIMRKALASDIEDRFESADEFIKALNGEIKVQRIDNKRKHKNDDSQQKGTKITIPQGKGFSAIAGMHELKEQMQVEVIDALHNPEEYAKYGLTIPNGMLLYGPPGCGKTFFAKHFAEEVGFNFMFIKPSSLKSRFVNATQENIAQMFKDAEENAPTIIFIDEMNELVPNRDSDVHEMARGAVNEMLAQMDRTGEKGIFIIGATNYPNMIDPAILRAGRLDKKYYIGTPDFEARKLMFELYLKSRPYDFGLDYDKLAQLTEDYVSSDIEMIINDASRIALRQKSKITMAILEDVISKTKPSLTAYELKKYLAIKSQMDGEASSSTPRSRVGFNA